MKKILLIAALIFSFIVPQVQAELNNITTEGVDGNWVIYDGSKNIIATFDATNRKLSIPSGSGLDVESGGYFKLAGTAVTATAANLNAVPTATGTGLEIDAMTKNVYSSASTITLGAGGAVTQAAAIQLKDADGNAIAAVQKIRVYVSDDAAGATPATSGCNGAVTVSVGATLKVQTEKLDWDLVTDANGAVTLTFDNTGGGGAYTKYVVVVLPNGKVLVSAALNVATA